MINININMYEICNKRLFLECLPTLQNINSLYTYVYGVNSSINLLHESFQNIVTK